METIEIAIESAYQEEIISLYRALSNAILAANDDLAAQDRFKKGLQHAMNVRNVARANAGLGVEVIT